MEYVSHVLPTLGEDSVDQRAVTELVEGLEASRADTPDVARLKAEPRIGEVVRRGAELASEGEPQELVVRLEGRFVGVEADEAAELLAEARAELGLSAAARERFRMNVLRALLRGLRRAPRRASVSLVRGGRARAAQGRPADAVPRPFLAVAEAGTGRAPAARFPREHWQRPRASYSTSRSRCFSAAGAAVGATPTCR